MKKKHICVITGTRAEYGLLKSLIQKIEESNKLKLSLLVTGMHLLKKYGETINIIKEDGISIAKVIPMYDEDVNMEIRVGLGFGKAVINFTEAFYEIKPDLLLVWGDRYEPLAAVIAASTLTIPIAHIQGGDSVFMGQVDEQIRHAITKFANIHFPISPKSSRRIKLLGEEEWRIHMYGSPGLDIIYEEELYTKEEICKLLGLNSKEKIILCIFHPYIFESNKAGFQITEILDILQNLKIQTVIIYPNNDPGSDLIIKEIIARENVEKFKIFKNLKRKDYLSLLKNVDLLIGNSSSGITEAPSFKIPVVNLGNRNKGRETGENVIHSSFESSEIIASIKKGFSKEFKELCKNVENPYGKGKAVEKVVKALEDININKNLLIKKITYNV